MKQEIIMAGFGGQGIMSMGKILAYAGMKEGKEVTWMPSYGPEMRGGTANCTVVLSNSKIASPLSEIPDVVIVMNLPSLKKFTDSVKPGGTIFINSSMVDQQVKRDDIKIFKIPGNEIAVELGSDKITNMVMLGAYLSFCDIVQVKTVEKALKQILPARRHNLIPLNKKALQRGARQVSNVI